MSSFEGAIDFVLDNEGGFVDHPSDPGGATNFGVSLRALKQLEGNKIAEWDMDGDGDVDADDMKLITVEMARDFYLDHFWSRHYERITDQHVATKVFDMAVNMGQAQAGRILQRACNWAVPMLKVDGMVGPKTVGVVNTMSNELPYFLPAEQARFYYQITDSRPSRAVFLLGWLRRSYHWPT